MKHLILGFMVLFLASITPAQAGHSWKGLVTMSGKKIDTVEGATRIDISTAKTLHERGVRFIDSRGSPWWEEGHIPGAIDLEYPTKATLVEVAGKNEEVVFYCDCDVGSDSCNRSPESAARAVYLGYQKVYFFTNSHEWGPMSHPTDWAE